MSEPKKTQPAMFLRIFRWYCHPALADHIEGDLVEEYQLRVARSGKRRADLWLILDIILLCRPGIVRPYSGRQQINSFGMYKSYFKIGWRNLVRNSGYSFINIGGLAIGMTVAILNGLWIWDELTFDRYHKNYERIGQIAETGLHDDGRFLSTSMTFPLSVALMEDYRDQFKHIARTSWPVGPIVAAADKKLSSRGLYVDAAMPEMLTLEMVRGDRLGLKAAHTMILSESLATSLFGDEDPVGKTVRINNKVDATVVGVYRDLPGNTRFSDMKFFGSWDIFLAEQKWIEQRAINDWRNHFLRIYIELEHTDFERVTKAIKPALKIDPRDLEQATAEQKELCVYPMSRWHLYPENDQGNGDPVRMLKLVGAIGVFILVLACINFMNLSTARSEKRAKEVGIRKTIGSVRTQLIGQFFSESFVIVFFAFLFALGLAMLFLPSFNELSAKTITMPWSSWFFWLAGVAFVVFTSIIAGSYPALYLSSFSPTKALKGRFRAGRFAATPRRVLVVTQFAISVLLITCTVVVYQQIQFAKSRPVGYDREGLLMIQKRSGDFFGKYHVMRDELKKTGAVEEVSESMGPVTDIVSGNNGWDWRGRNPAIDESFATLSVSHTHGRTAGWQFVDGRDFSLDVATDSSGIVINESAAKVMGLKNPVGEQVSWKWWVDGRVYNYTILGVIRDMVMDSPYDRTTPTIFYLKGFNGTPSVINIRINPSISPREALAKIEPVFRKLIPEAPFEYKFVDDEYNRKFAAEERVGKLALVFAALAIFISCLGLLGLVSFVAEQRTKEIGIRKVLGATVLSVWRLLSKDFIMLVLIACVVAIPLGYYAMNEWLRKYAYRIELTGWTFAGICMLAILIAVMTVSFQAVRAALASPVKSLRSE